MKPEPRYVVMYSGGIGSWCAAARLVERGIKPTLLFTDTLIEDPDLYRFLDEGAAALGLTVTRLADGRTPFQTFIDSRMLGNSQFDPCSRILKRELAHKWVAEHLDPDLDVIVMGYDYSEDHRVVATENAYSPYRVEAPMTERPWLMKAQQLEMALSYGVKPPHLYALGFRHNNCGGGCVKAGQAAWRQLLVTHPDRFEVWERQEQIMRHYLGKDVAMLKERNNGESRPLTLRNLRGRIERNEGCDLLDWGGCGCFAPSDDEA